MVWLVSGGGCLPQLRQRLQQLWGHSPPVEGTREQTPCWHVLEQRGRWTEGTQAKRGQKWVNKQWSFHARPWWASVHGYLEFLVLLWRLRILTEFSGLGNPSCCSDPHAALGGCHLESPVPEDSLQTGGVAGCTQKTHLIHLNATCSKVATKNRASGPFSLCNNNIHIY